MRSTSVRLLIAAALAGTACHTMQPLSWSDLEGLRPSSVWVTQEDNSVVQLAGPRLFGDTIVGYVAGEFRELPTASVQKVAVRRLARWRTIGLIAGGTAVATAIAVWMSGVGDPDPDADVDCMEFPEEPECIF